MHILITGGAGFIGSQLCERLLADGARVTVLDDLSTGRLRNLEGCLENPSFRFVRGSVLDAERVAAELASCTDVIHLAAAVGVRLVLEAPVRTLTTNVEGARAVLEGARRHGVRVFFASSSEVYGSSRKLPYREDAPLSFGPTVEPRWSYACSKALGEWLCLAHAREDGLEVVIGRFFNTVGPGQRARYGMVLPNFARQALRGEPITVFGDGSQTRAFCHVRDTVEATVRLLRAPEATGGVFNVGGTHEVTIGALAELVRERAGSTSPIVHMPYREAYGTDFRDLKRRVPDTSRLRAATGFEPRVSLEEIVEDVLAAERIGVGGM